MKNLTKQSFPEKTDVLFLIVGKSGSGKDTLVNEIQKYTSNWKSVKSYTTRAKRNEEDNGHIFISNEEFKKIKPNLVAYTFFNNNHYGITSEELDKCNFYIIDKKGVESLNSLYKTNRPIITIYISTTWYTRLFRMLKRGDKISQAISRLIHDYKAFKGLQYTYNVDGNKNFEEVFKEFSFFVYFESIMSKGGR